MKTCARCKKPQPTSAFYFDAYANRFRSYCKECSKLNRRASYDLAGTTERGYFTALRAQARRRHIDVSLTFEAFRDFRAKPCAYGGGARPDFRIGLDRKDCAAGYTVANVVPCCARHNGMKNQFFSHKEMLLLVKTIPSAAACGNSTAGRPKLLRAILQ